MRPRQDGAAASPVRRVPLAAAARPGLPVEQGHQEAHMQGDDTAAVSTALRPLGDFLTDARERP